MKTNSKFKWFLALMLGVVVTVSGQRKKEYTERFSVEPDVTIEVNTSYADVEFETWNRNEVVVEARVEVEGISEEEAEAYFKNWDFTAQGNSGKVSVSAKSGPRFFAGRGVSAIVAPGAVDIDFDFEVPEMEAIEPMISELRELPPMPPVMFENLNDLSFDYEAYKEEGDAYLERWKKEFNENFDKNFKEKFKVWQKEFKARTKAMEQHKKEMEKHREQTKKRREEMKKHYEAAAKEREKAKEERRKAIEEMKEEMSRDNKTNTFFYRSDSKDRNIKVKKTIKIKMPKDAKLKMNVRHGEVKIAENFKNIKATLSHTRLLAAMVDGEQTFIEASYSPVVVERWNQGKLRVNYGKEIAIKNVKNVELFATSSDVFIGTITGDAVIKGNFGKVEIEKIANDFKALEMVLDNTEAFIGFPKTAFNFYCNTSNSEINFPGELTLEVSKSRSGQVAKGYYKQKNSNKNINLTAAYSEVVMVIR